ncbi:MAG: DeoR family transcriptional regulator [Patescibacteria group bacterium]|nr:DeoR family transcriptional regulator [Patescibacteria group bacterium]
MSGKQYFGKKAYEIAYSIFRIAARIPEKAIAEKLTNAATELLAQISSGNYAATLGSLETLSFFCKLGTDLGFISYWNNDILVREIGNFQAAIAESLNEENKDIDISGIFTNPPQRGEESQPTGYSERRGEPSIIRHTDATLGETFPQQKESFAIGQDSRTDEGREHKKTEASQSGNFIKSGMRQIAILDKIRQSGNCRLRDIQEILPEVSERTIRYDLEDLIERNIIERIGTGGPSVSYRIRQMA